MGQSVEKLGSRSRLYNWYHKQSYLPVLGQIIQIQGYSKVGPNSAICRDLTLFVCQ